MKHTYKIVGLLIAIASVQSSLIAHKYTFTNHTNDDIKLDFNGEAVIGGKMMQGKIPAWHGGGYEERQVNATTTAIRNAGHRSGEYLLKKGHTVDFNFNGIDFGICLDQYAVFINGTQYTVLSLPGGQWDELFAQTKNLSTSNLATNARVMYKLALCRSAEIIIVNYGTGKTYVIAKN